jgi:hypothetical protein
MSQLDQLLNSPRSWVKYSPWEQEDYCNEQGQCWFQQYGKWILAHPGTVVNAVACLPGHINPTSEGVYD